MGLFGGKREEELRTSGTPTTARVVYVDDTGKRRENDIEGQDPAEDRLRIGPGTRAGQDEVGAGAAHPRVGEIVQIRFDPDDVDDWAWGDAAM